jgi:hypothetical protein
LNNLLTTQQNQDRKPKSFLCTVCVATTPRKARKPYFVPREGPPSIWTGYLEMTALVPGWLRKMAEWEGAVLQASRVVTSEKITLVPVPLWAGTS